MFSDNTQICRTQLSIEFLQVNMYGIPVSFSAISVTKGNNFHDFILTSLDNVALLKYGLLLKERICSF